MSEPAIKGATVKPLREPTLTWKPLGDGSRLTFQNTSHDQVRAALFQAFGMFPIRLSKAKGDVVALQAMYCVANAMGKAGAPYEQLIAALNKYGDVEVSDA